MNIETLSTALHKQLASKESITYEQVTQWREVYPYFSLPLMLYTIDNHSCDANTLALSTIYAGSINEWASRLGIQPQYNTLYPTSESTQAETTDSAIDLFLHTYGKDEEIATTTDIIPQSASIQSDEKPQHTTSDIKQYESDDPLKSLISIPAYDYMSELEAMPDMENSEPMQGDDLLEKFLEADAAGEQLFSKPEFTANTQTIASQEPAIDENESLFSESLAKIYIQQRRYAKALEIIRKLSLNNPEKNIYFADQIRFLEKLIINVKN